LLIVLSLAAQQRGVDAGGLAVRIQANEPREKPGATDSSASDCADVSVAGWRVLRTIGPLQNIWRADTEAIAANADTLFGHTRWATQGSADQLCNTSPLLAGDVIGCHNGDIDAPALRSALSLPDAVGETDSEAIFQALDMFAGQGRDEVEVLVTMIGRAAITWVDRRRPELMHLARAGLSPLAICTDEQGNLLWASNPQWLRSSAMALGATITPPRMVREGTWLSFDGPTLVAERLFTPAVRSEDLDAAHLAVWQGFNDTDRRLDANSLHHRIVESAESFRDSPAAA
jgi:hypothetical protein